MHGGREAERLGRVIFAGICLQEVMNYAMIKVTAVEAEWNVRLLRND